MLTLQLLEATTAHPTFEGRVKIGDTTLPPSIQRPEDATQEVLEKAARKRIDSYTKTTDLEYTLEHVELAVRPVNLNDESEGIEGFRDYKIHALLKRNGHKKSFARKDKKSGERFYISPVSLAPAYRQPALKTSCEAKEFSTKFIVLKELS